MRINLQSLSRFLLPCLASLIFLPLPSYGSADETTPAVPDTATIAHAVEGPWGRLQYYHFYLEAPEHLVALLPPPRARTRWAVPVDQVPELNQAFRSAGLTNQQLEEVMDPSIRVVADGLYSLFPNPHTVLSLSPKSRTSLYNFLSRFSVNGVYSSPVQFFSGDVRQWAKDTSIREDLVDLIDELIYYRGDVKVFGDIPLILSACRTESEVMDMAKHFTRVRTMVVRLEVSKDSNLDQIVNYWSTGLGLRRKDIEPLLRAAIQTEGVSLIDMLHLLPPLPRKLLYTYPDISMATDGRMPDCHWTSLNFFNYNPQGIYLDERLAATAVMERFDRVDPPYQYGDVIMFITDDDRAHHSCTYLAADIVFTKNGYNVLVPWTLANLSDVANLYREFEGKALHMQGYRMRQPTH
ncbi:MAG: hypothetical protein KDK99_07855 [Verrucomicrobiales bacterium]|nr:hypothetical protein [Verrucomicrobiales bacterium]